MNIDCKGRIINLTEQEINNIINSKYSKYEYIGGYTGIDGYLYLMCKDCGHIFKHNAQLLRPVRYPDIRCSSCNTIIKKSNKKQTQLEKQQAREQKHKIKEALQMQLLKDKEQIKMCVECGKSFVTTKKNVVYCSNECAKKKANNHKDRRLKKCDVVDYSITLTKLFKRDKGICYICGKKVDMKADSNSDWYGSIDHVNAIANGGNHTWDNVRLAHRHCNSIKSDNNLYEKDNGQLTMAI